MFCCQKDSLGGFPMNVMLSNPCAPTREASKLGGTSDTETTSILSKEKSINGSSYHNTVLYSAIAPGSVMADSLSSSNEATPRMTTTSYSVRGLSYQMDYRPEMAFSSAIADG
ncbi:conserved hypothetical protein [Ricinus communis]|uniref:Uncharacterized protein n=1 Tax=Ricinus communis TaxID=3988 RepID=B9RX06_RICCO|nr:conserved hypothetical protein [Ricinus communis]